MLMMEENKWETFLHDRYTEFIQQTSKFNGSLYHNNECKYMFLWAEALLQKPILFSSVWNDTKSLL